jgi:transposase
MGRPPALPVEEKLRIVLDVLSGRTTIVQAARDHDISETAVCNWKRQFLEAGRAGLADGAITRDPVREAELRAENDALKEALRDASVQVRVWKVAAEGRLGPSRTLR